MSDNRQLFRGTRLSSTSSSSFQEDQPEKIHFKPLLNRKMADYNSTQRRDRSSFQDGKKRTTQKEEKDYTMSPSTSKGIPSFDIRKKRTEHQRVTKIWIIGSSYVRRAERPAYQIFGENLGLNAQVKWFGKGGMRWREVLPRFYSQLSTQGPPDILVVHAGGNDLGLTPARELISRMKGDLMQLHEEFPSMKIVYSCINERQSWKYGKPKWINNDRKDINRVMRKAVACCNGEVIEHPHLRFFDDSVFLADRVHFSRKGNEIFLTSIHNVIKRILQGRERDSSSLFNVNKRGGKEMQMSQVFGGLPSRLPHGASCCCSPAHSHRPPGRSAPRRQTPT
ncbi:uncharacterized protein LOC125015220 isoform X2 [Mugil cephalus]|uniref:uncharacterized protein LOC125015220 isoform X2 n=1 Tax=Mugil cephalus TaxID=48193 RepID=UPI001FB800ED|nr:uncharacterized protein LOC125015220 isoform X2 [Mugil cephalus]